MAKKTSIKKSPAKVKASENYLEKLETNIQSNQSKVSMVLGALIVLVVGILVYNYFTKNNASLGPAQQIEQKQEQQDIAKDKLPGSYTVKEDDTLFTIAEKYYQDGSKFTEIAKANNLSDVDSIETGQKLEIPKISAETANLASPSPSALAEASPAATEDETQELGTGTGGGNNTVWGPKIEGNTYTVTEGDWLSTIAGRAYEDITAFEKIAQANNIVNVDHIEPGWVLTIPR
ncbi:LysM peptidoglycan-binding domain-containing protein [Candidatus Daviesbacteria bacterium]|nr:LysM peptidoglycan-binding domain-containing protein [Candidatus Daviesbacteria bacterium]